MRTVFIGDVHGCREELESLLGVLTPAPDDRLVFLGDLIDRGPDSAGVVQLVRAMANTQCILGNHDERALRYLRHQSKAATNPAYRNPMTVAPDRVAEWWRLGPEDLAFLQSLPATLSAAGFLAVHGGLLPGRPLESQKLSLMIRLRWVGADGKAAPSPAAPDEIPLGARPWMEVFDGAFNVVCGHAVHDLRQPRFDRSASGNEIWSIDTGCVFGGHLTALVLDSERPDERGIVQVPAQREYARLEDAEAD